MTPTLLIGNKNYSSWSLRGYLPLALAGVELEERLIVLDTPTSKDELRRQSPTGLVPVLLLEDAVVWESLAIAEYAAEVRPSLWPADPRVRAEARSVACEMHAGFSALRRDMPMNIRGRHPGVGHSAEALADVARVLALWDRLLAAHGGPFLFGDEPTIADVMFAPVVTRFITYAVHMPSRALAYAGHVVELPPMAAWIAAARDEPWTCEVSEPGSSSWQGGPLQAE